MRSINSTLFLIIVITFLTHQGVNSQSIPLNWQVGMINNINDKPSKFYDATIPGAVQLDYMNAHNLEHFSINDNVNEYGKLERKYWCYITSFDKPELNEEENLVFYSKGIDYEFDIILNDSLLLHQEGMFTPVRLLLNKYLKEQNTLRIIIYPVPIAEGQPVGRRQAILAVKPPVPYGWDWHPRLIPVGIWDETAVIKEPKIKILINDLSYELKNELSTAAIALQFYISESKSKVLTYSWNLYDAKNNRVATSNGLVNDGKTELFYDLNKPFLWYPHDHGIPYLYTSVLQIKDANGKLLDEEQKKLGFRKVELIMNDNAWNEPSIFPKSRSTAPFALRINNRNIFAKGSNWVHPEIFYGTISGERYFEQLELVKKCNMNMLRIWGGGITNKESFFEQCDSLGIMVWQEFPLACNNYPNDNHYLKILEQETISIISRVKKHPCLVIWSGGNELFNSWSGMTEQAHALRLLNSLTYQHDKNTPFINTSPIYGVGHGHYLFYDKTTNEDVFQLMKRSNNTAYTEFGMPSLASVEVLEQIIPAEDLFPVKPTEAWKIHGAFESWRQTSWLEKQTIEKYFGKAENLKELVWQSQTLQSIGYKAIFEEARRQKPTCSMALNWCFNEPWPNAANNNLITYPNIPKPAFYAVMASLRPVTSSAALSRFDWGAGDILELELWMLNDTYQTVDKGKMDVFITIDGNKIKIGVWSFNELQQNKNMQGPTLRYFIPENVTTQLVKISLELNHKEEYNSEYFLLVTSKQKEKRKVNSLNF
jgi:beta-mannosidase